MRISGGCDIEGRISHLYRSCYALYALTDTTNRIMATLARSLCAILLFLSLAAPRLHAQVASTDSTATTATYATEINLIETALGTVVKVLQEATFSNTGTAVGKHLRLMADRLNTATGAFSTPNDPMSTSLLAVTPSTEARNPSEPITLTAGDLQRLETLLLVIHNDLRTLRQALLADQQDETADRLFPIERSVDDAVNLVQHIVKEEDTAPTTTLAIHDGSRWMRANRSGHKNWDDDDWLSDFRSGLREAGDEMRDAGKEVRSELNGAGDEVRDAFHEARDEIRAAGDEVRDALGVRKRTRDRYRRTRDRWRRAGFDRHSDVGTFVGDFDDSWPFRETALYRPIPANRYNRVEGLVLGFGLRPLEWYDYERGKIYGQAGYSFGLDSWRYEIGAETRPGDIYNPDFDFKLGGSYRRNTATNDLWKASWAENSLAAFFVENDFFDFYEVEGWTLYTAARVGSFLQLSGGYRSDDYRSLVRNTGWSLFNGNGFRENPAINEGRMQSLVFSIEGGDLWHRYSQPRGAIFRAEVEVGEGMGGDFSFTRYLGDVRFHLPTGRYSTLSFRFRGGIASDEAPIQKQFTLGGVGSSLAYPQNAFLGSRMALGNVEYNMADVTLFDDFLEDINLFGFFDAMWVNSVGGTNTFDMDDVLPGAGLGLALDDQFLRLELAWPLRSEFAGTKEPTLWLRLNPKF